MGMAMLGGIVNAGIVPGENVLIFDLDKKRYSFEKLTDEIEETEKKIDIYRKNSEQIKKNQDKSIYT